MGLRELDVLERDTNRFYLFVDVICQMDLPNCQEAGKHRRVHGILGILYFLNLKKKGLKGDMPNC